MPWGSRLDGALALKIHEFEEAPARCLSSGLDDVLVAPTTPRPCRVRTRATLHLQIRSPGTGFYDVFTIGLFRGARRVSYGPAVPSSSTSGPPFSLPIIRGFVVQVRRGRLSFSSPAA